MANVLFYTPEQIADAMYYSGHPDSIIMAPRIADGRYALPQTVLTDPRHAEVASVLRRGIIGDDAGLVYENPYNTFKIVVDGQLMYLSAAKLAHAYGVPALGVHRFEGRKGETGFSGDAANGNRRSELVSDGYRYMAGEHLWESFTMILGETGASMEDEGLFCILNQWHSVDTSVARSPVFSLTARDGIIQLSTRSHRDGPNVLNTHHTMPRPAKGVALNYVVHGFLGQNGHLDVWLNGNQIVNVDTPIGYYNDMTNGQPRALAYPHWGLYEKDSPARTVVYFANIEFGTQEKSARIPNPLPVSNFPIK